MDGTSTGFDLSALTGLFSNAGTVGLLLFVGAIYLFIRFFVWE